MATTCAVCGKPATKESTMGRPLCDEHYAFEIGVEAGGSAYASGSGVGEAIMKGYVAKAYVGSVDAEKEAVAAREAKLASTQGFLKRLWVRVVG